MKPQHVALGILITIIWGFNFVVLKVALIDLPPMLLTALRFTFACLPVLFLPKPKLLSWKHLVIVGLASFLGQYIFLFVAIKQGMPAGLSSVTLQLQVFLTVLLSVILLGDRPNTKQILGGIVALAGLATIASTVGKGSTIPATAMVFIVLAAASWAYGNFTTRIAGPNAGLGTLAGVCWLSLIPPLPAYALAFAFEGFDRIYESLIHIHLITVLALAYTVVFSTWIGFIVWGKLLATYPAGTAAPFALLVPVFGGISGYVFLGETLSPLRLLGSAFIFIGLAVILLPLNRIFKNPVKK